MEEEMVGKEVDKMKILKDEIEVGPRAGVGHQRLSDNTVISASIVIR